MKKNNLKEKKVLQTLDAEWLLKELKEAQKELYILKIKKVSNELKETHLLKMYKTYIARINTYLEIIKS